VGYATPRDLGLVQVSGKASVHSEIQASWKQLGKPCFERPEKDYRRYDLEIDISTLKINLLVVQLGTPMILQFSK